MMDGASNKDNDFALQGNEPPSNDEEENGDKPAASEPDAPTTPGFVQKQLKEAYKEAKLNPKKEEQPEIDEVWSQDSMKDLDGKFTHGTYSTESKPEDYEDEHEKRVLKGFDEDQNDGTRDFI